MVLGEEENVLIREVSLFQGCPYRGVPLYVQCFSQKKLQGGGRILVTTRAITAFQVGPSKRNPKVLYVYSTLDHLLCW